MKKLIATALLALQLFTICGHMLLYQYFVYRSDQLFNEQISKNKYNVNDLVEIKLPGHTALFKDWASFEPVSGQVQFKNACYNYVKLKLTSDTIYLMCVPDYGTTRFVNQNIINAREISDIPVNKKDHVPFGKLISPDNFNYAVALVKFLPAILNLSISTFHFNSCAIKCYLDIPGPPPKMPC